MTLRPTPVLLSVAFRPFFLLAAIWAAASMGLWLAALTGASWLPAPGPAWHAHELLFGVVAAAAAGFALTAVATWTGTPALAGWPLLGLVLLWLAGRLIWLITGGPTLVTAGVNLMFLPAVCLALLSRLLPAGNRRNYPLALILLVFTAAQATWYFGPAWQQLGVSAGMLTVAAMISLIGGRITPAFTRNWLRAHQRLETVRDFPALEIANVGALLLAAVAILLGMTGLTAGLTLIAAAAAAARCTGWNSGRILGEPLLWVLHLAWLWLVLGLLLNGLTGLGLLPMSLGWHALGAGTIGTILIGVMTRVSLGHTGRPLVLPQGSTFLYVLITLAALSRVGSAAFPALNTLPMLAFAAIAWFAAWIGFLLLFAPMLLSPRPDGRPG